MSGLQPKCAVALNPVEACQLSLSVALLDAFPAVLFLNSVAEGQQ
jgi:hypothetical protein